MPPTFDTISIVIGLFIGITITFLLIRYIPRFLKKKDSTKNNEKRRNRESSNDWLLRKHILSKLQKLHLASDLYPLSDIYIPQYLYSHPYHANYDGLLEEEPLFYRDALSIADVPELALEYPLPKITLAQALSKGCNIAISGGIGTGKSSCLANLSIEIIEKRCVTAWLNEYFPIYLHVLDIIGKEKSSLLEIISQVFFDEGLDLSPPEIIKLLDDYLNRSKLLLLIDGLDELRKDEFDSTALLINRFRNDHPNLLIVTTCGPFYSGKLSAAGFSILPIRPPDREDQEALFTLWQKIFAGVSNNTGKPNLSDKDNKIIKRWFQQEGLSATFTDFTLVILAYFYHEHVPNNLFIIPYLNRLSGNSLSLNILTNLADLFSNSSFLSTRANNLQKFNAAITNSANNTSVGLIDLLIDRNVLQLHGDHLRFTNPSVLCQLLALSENYQHPKDIYALIHSPIDNLATLYSESDRKYLSFWIDNLNLSDGRQISITLNHLFFVNSNIPDISNSYPKIAQLLISPSLPLSTKIKIASIVYYTNLSVFLQLLSKLITVRDAETIKLCAFFYGFLPEDKYSAIVRKIIQNEQEGIALYGLIALLNSANTHSAENFSEIFLEIPDKYGRLTAELCSQYRAAGHKALRDLSKSENTVLRRYSVYGLRLIPQQRSRNLLEEINRNDSAWIIRDAAANALNNMHKPSIYAPDRLGPAAENAVLIKAASRFSSGISAESVPFDLLFTIIENGTLNERITALRYLSEKPNKNSIQQIIKLTSSANPLREIASRVLYEIYLRT